MHFIMWQALLLSPQSCQIYCLLGLMYDVREEKKEGWVLIWPTPFAAVWSLSAEHGYVGARMGLQWGWWPTGLMPPIKCWQGWAQNKLPIPPYRLKRHHGNEGKKLGPPIHSTHALLSSVKRLRSSTAVYFRAEITMRALMWNIHDVPLFIFSVSHYFVFCFPSHPLQGYRSYHCAWVMWWLLRYKGLAPSYNFPFQPKESQKRWRTSQLSSNRARAFQPPFSARRGNLRTRNKREIVLSLD